jgi:SpoVK/Ycf46/Vps4 family AAA+-type ATPase
MRSYLSFIKQSCFKRYINHLINEVVEGTASSELLHAYNLRARNRLLFIGPPGNGKTTLAEAVAND